MGNGLLIIFYFLLISNRRAPVAKKIYEELGGSSPILKLTMEQSKALETKLNQTEMDNEYKCFIVMRCWNPRANDVIKDVQSFNPKEIILMPLYPQYSAATSGSSIKEWKNVCKKNRVSNISNIGWQAGFEEAAGIFSDIILRLCKISEEKKKVLILNELILIALGVVFLSLTKINP